MDFSELKQKASQSLDSSITDDPSFCPLLNELTRELNKNTDESESNHLIIGLNNDYDYELVTEVMYSLGYRISAKLRREKTHPCKSFHAWKISYFG